MNSISQLFRLESKKTSKNHFFWRDTLFRNSYSFFIFHTKNDLDLPNLQEAPKIQTTPSEETILFIFYLSHIFTHKRILSRSNKSKTKMVQDQYIQVLSLVKRVQMNLVEMRQIWQKFGFRFFELNEEKRNMKPDVPDIDSNHTLVYNFSSFFFFFFSGWSRNNLTFASRHE